MTSSDFRASNLLRDFVFELNELVDQSAKENRDYQSGLFAVTSILHNQLEAFDIDQSEYPRPLMDPDQWFLGKGN